MSYEFLFRATKSGFTAWSSVREPSQVFQLLETLYNAFDEIAGRRRVFKVETVRKFFAALMSARPVLVSLHLLLLLRSEIVTLPWQAVSVRVMLSRCHPMVLPFQTLPLTILLVLARSLWQCLNLGRTMQLVSCFGSQLIL